MAARTAVGAAIDRRSRGSKNTFTQRAVARRTYEGFADLYRADANEARALLAVGDSPHDAELPVPESAAWTMLTNQLMNLDEVLNK